MAQVERATSLRGKRYLTNKAVVFGSVETKNIQIGGKDNGNGLLQLYDDDDVLYVNMDKTGITLSNGAAIVGGDGLLTNLQFSSGKSAICGWGYNTILSDYEKQVITLNAFIPEDFTITSAILTLTHIPYHFYDGVVSSAWYWGYARNLKLYKGDTSGNFAYEAILGSDLFGATGTDYTEISSAFGSSGFTPTTPNDTTYEVEQEDSIDIKAYLSAGNNELKIETGDSSISTGTDPSEDVAASKQSGYCNAILNIIGFIK